MSANSSNNVLAPFDPTAYSSISGAQLLQFVQGLLAYTDKGFLIVTTDVATVPDVPPADTDTTLQRYIWLRKGASALTPYVWNDAAANHTDGGGNNIKKWYTVASASIGVGTITGDMIANNTIPDRCIISIDWSKITGTPTGFTPSGAAGGDLTGNYPNPAVAAGAITTSKIAALNITNPLIAALTIDAPAKIAPSGTGLSVLRTNTGATAPEWAVIKITEMANPASAADVGKVVVVDSPYTNGFKLVAPDLNIGKILQVAETIDVSKESGTGTMTIGATGLTWGDGDQMSGLDIAITPKSATSKLIVEATIQISANNNYNVTVAGFRAPSGTDPALCVNCSYVAGSNLFTQINMRFQVDSSSTSATSFKFRIGLATAGTWYKNRTATAALFNSLLASSVKVTEVTSLN